MTFIDPGTDLLRVESLASLSAGNVIVDQNADAVRLVHCSTTEYLENDRQKIRSTYVATSWKNPLSTLIDNRLQRTKHWTCCLPCIIGVSMPFEDALSPPKISRSSNITTKLAQLILQQAQFRSFRNTLALFPRFDQVERFMELLTTSYISRLRTTCQRPSEQSAIHSIGTFFHAACHLKPSHRARKMKAVEKSYVGRRECGKEDLQWQEDVQLPTTVDEIKLFLEMIMCQQLIWWPLREPLRKSPPGTRRWMKQCVSDYALKPAHFLLTYISRDAGRISKSTFRPSSVIM